MVVSDHWHLNGKEVVSMGMPAGLSNEEVQAAWVNLTEEVRTGVLLTLRTGRPFGSHVPYVFGDHWTRAYIHLSRLALHTGHLLHDSHVGLFISEPDKPEKNPLALRRMNLQGEAVQLNAGAPDYVEVKERYLARFPQSAMMFGFADFSLWELRLENAHLVLGFGQAYIAEATTPLAWTHQKPEQNTSAKSI
jgi:heme iron utilization protein